MNFYDPRPGMVLHEVKHTRCWADDADLVTDDESIQPQSWTGWWLWTRQVVGEWDVARFLHEGDFGPARVVRLEPAQHPSKLSTFTLHLWAREGAWENLLQEVIFDDGGMAGFMELTGLNPSPVGELG